MLPMPNIDAELDDLKRGRKPSPEVRGGDFQELLNEMPPTYTSMSLIPNLSMTVGKKSDRFSRGSPFVWDDRTRRAAGRIIR
jgi:hypothetical protein